MANGITKGDLAGKLALIATLFSIIASVYGGYKWYTSKLDSYNLNGQWKFVFTVKQSSMKSYVDMVVGYKIFVEQNDKSVHGVGAKWWVNNEVIPYTQHDKLEFQGVIKDGILNATYTLYGEKTTTSGGFTAKVKNDKQLMGDYAGTAADTKGSFIANKE